MNHDIRPSALGLVVLCSVGSDAETWLEDRRHHPGVEEGDQNHEHRAVHAHDGLVTGTDWTHRTDAGWLNGGLLLYKWCLKMLIKTSNNLKMNRPV